MIDPIALLSRQDPAFTIGAETRSLHLARIHASLVVPVVAPQASRSHVGSLHTASVSRFRRFDWRQRLTAATVAFIVAIPSAAVATESSQPDTWLYPVKLAVEPVWLLVDDDIVAKHRIEELRFALTKNHPIDTVLIRADTAVARLDPDSIWRRELDLIKHSLNDQTDVVETGGAESDGPNDSTVIEKPADPEPSEAVEKSEDSDISIDESHESTEIGNPDDAESNPPNSDESDEESDDESDDEGDSHDDEHEGD